MLSPRQEELINIDFYGVLSAQCDFSASLSTERFPA